MRGKLGTPLPCPPVEPGNDCPLCTPVRWAVGETPKYVFATFVNIIDCGKSRFTVPNGHVFRLQQNAASDCNWFWEGDNYHVFFDAKMVAPPLSRLRLFDSDGFSFFGSLSIGCPLEYWRYVNNQGACILMYAGALGTGRVWWNDKNMEFVEGLGLNCGAGSFNETFPGPSTKVTTKFNNLYQRTNLRIQTKPS